MSSVAEIERAIERLSPTDEKRLREWFLQRAEPDDNEDVLVPPAYRQKILDALDKP